MKWSWRIGTIAGIDVYVHGTFGILLAWIALVYHRQGGPAAAVQGVLFILVLFGIVVLHELGHALAARRYGIATRDITLLPFGGVARLERMPDDPRQELVVALAGPAVNVALAGICAGLLLAGQGLPAPGRVAHAGGQLLGQLLYVNVVLAVFNMLPAFPMDGGRVLRALLALKLDYVEATQVAAAVGQGLALVMGFVGLAYNPMLLLIALFVWMGAGQEANMVVIKRALAGIPVRQAMITELETLRAGDTVGRAAELVLEGFQHDFPVLDDGGGVLGLLTRQDLLAALASGGVDVPVEEVMHRELEIVHPNDLLEPVLMRLEACDCQAMPVVQDGRLVGIANLENIGEFMMIRRALGQDRAAARAP